MRRQDFKIEVCTNSVESVRAALAGGVDAREGLLGIREGLHGILFGDGGFGVFVQTRSGEEKHRKGGKSEFYIA